MRGLKRGDGPDPLTQGSSDFLQTPLAEELTDELRLLIYPVTLGAGKRLFGVGAQPAAFRLTRSVTSSSGVLVATHERAGDVRTGSFALETPAQAELGRRRHLV